MKKQWNKEKEKKILGDEFHKFFHTSAFLCAGVHYVSDVFKACLDS